MAVPACRILLEGPPGVGKTTLVRALIARLCAAGIPVGGFVTRELREHGRRVGFVAEEINGPGAVIAGADWSQGLAVGRYRVDVQAFERIALPALERARVGAGVVVVDELGRMELASAACVRAVHELLGHDLAVVATVHAVSDPVTDALKRRPDIRVFRVCEENRDELSETLAGLIVPGRARPSEVTRGQRALWRRSRE